MNTQVKVTFSNFDDVRAFHQKFGLLCFDAPGMLTQRQLLDRVEFMQEEVAEFDEARQVLDMAGMADALIDLVYVAMGTGVQLGLPWQALWDDVQRANMVKVRGMTKRGHAVDVTKPPGWVGPRTMEILLEHGYDPEAAARGYQQELPL